MLGSDNKIAFTIAKDDSPSVHHEWKQSATVSPDAWTYVLISGKMTNGRDTTV